MKELLTYWPQLLLLVLSVIAYGIKELQQHSKLKWQKSDASFWGEHSWMRKWKFVGGQREAFPLSSSLLVWITDGMHLMQAIFVNGICLSVSLLFPNWWLTFLIVRGIWGIVFSATYKLLSR